jgi:hypothetical protein
MSGLTPLQLEILKTFSRPLSEKQVLEIRQLLADYFAQQLDTQVDTLFEKQGWGNEKAEQWLHEHNRTPYRSEG